MLTVKKKPISVQIPSEEPVDELVKKISNVEYLLIFLLLMIYFALHVIFLYIFL